jgi:hypothetical protein
MSISPWVGEGGRVSWMGPLLGEEGYGLYRHLALAPILSAPHPDHHSTCQTCKLLSGQQSAQGAGGTVGGRCGCGSVGQVPAPRQGGGMG